MAAENPLEQFAVKKIIPLNIGGLDVSFTNASLFMVIAVVLITLFMVAAMRPKAIVPGRFQGAAEMFYEFIDNMLVENIGNEGRRYFPFVFSIFMFVFFCNLLGLLPIGLAEGGFTVTSQIVVTFALALVVFIVVTIIGFMRHGLHFLRFFVPHGVPWPILPVLVPIEVMSYCIRPVTLSVRLFANMVAGQNQWPHTGADEMFFEAGMAARNGLTAARLAGLGAYGSEKALDGEAGLLTAYRPDHKVPDIRLFDGEPEIMSVFFKPAPVCNFAQTPSLAALALANEEKIDPDAVSRQFARRLPRKPARSSSSLPVSG